MLFKSFGLATVFCLLFTIVHSSPIPEKEEIHLNKRLSFPIITEDASRTSGFDVQAINKSLEQQLGTGTLLQNIIGPNDNSPTSEAR
jgi:hypothetical protein